MFCYTKIYIINNTCFGSRKGFNIADINNSDRCKFKLKTYFYLQRNCN